MVQVDISRIEESVYESLLEKIGAVCKEYGARSFAHLGETDFDGNTEDAEAAGDEA
jgi:hypothetical protein